MQPGLDSYNPSFKKKSWWPSCELSCITTHMLSGHGIWSSDQIGILWYVGNELWRTHVTFPRSHSKQWSENSNSSLCMSASCAYPKHNTCFLCWMGICSNLHIDVRILPCGCLRQVCLFSFHKFVSMAEAGRHFCFLSFPLKGRAFPALPRSPAGEWYLLLSPAS